MGRSISCVELQKSIEFTTELLSNIFLYIFSIVCSCSIICWNCFRFFNMLCLYWHCSFFPFGFHKWFPLDKWVQKSVRLILMVHKYQVYRATSNNYWSFFENNRSFFITLCLTLETTVEHSHSLFFSKVAGLSPQLY